jgi:hypothetical protein
MASDPSVVDRIECPAWLLPAFTALKPPDKRHMDLWAEEHYEVAVSARPGKWRTSNAPWVRKMMRKIQDARIRVVVVQCSAQSSKTETMIVILAWIIAEDPAPTMWVTNNKEEAEKIMLERIWPTLRACKPVAVKIPDDRSLAKQCEIHFPGMTFEAGGANSKGFLQSRPRRNLLLDEVRSWKPWALPMVLKRVRTWWNSRVVIATTPAKVGDTADREYKAGTQEHYHVACPKCGRKISDLRFRIKKGEQLSPGVMAERDGGMTWTTNEVTKPGGRWNFDELTKTIRYVWPCCGAESRDEPWERDRIAESGEFVPYNPGAKADRVSFTWGAMLPPMVPWASVVDEFVRAKDALDFSGNIEPLKTFVCETLGVPWDERMRGMDEAEPMQCCRRRFDPTIPWEQEARRFCLVDVQEKTGRHYYWLVRAFAENGESRLIAYGIARSREELKDALDTWKVDPANLCMDTGFASADVYKMLVESGYSERTGTLWKGMKGERAENYLVAGIRQPYRFSDWIDPYHGTSLQGTVGFLKIILFSKAAMLDRVEFCQKGFGPGYHIPDEAPPGCPPLEEYISQATAYKRIDTENAQGFTDTKWHQLRRDDHWGSCERMAVVAAMATGLFSTPPPMWKKDRSDSAVTAEDETTGAEREMDAAIEKSAED